MKLYEIVKLRAEKQEELKQKAKEYEVQKSKLEAEINELLRLEHIGVQGIDVEKVQIAESLIYVEGDPYGITDDMIGGTIAECAIVDIANGCIKLKKKYFGNKKYDRFYQRCDCEYGYRPTHGAIVDSVGLRNSKKSNELTDEEKDACIYYLKNYNTIKRAKI